MSLMSIHNENSCSVSSSRPLAGAGSSSAGVHVCNYMNMKRATPGKKSMNLSWSPINTGWQCRYQHEKHTSLLWNRRYYTTSTCLYTEDMLTCSWEHLSSNTIWSYVTCITGACIRLRPSHVYRIPALEYRPMISLHATRWRHKRGNWTSVLTCYFWSAVQFCLSRFGVRLPGATQFVSSSDPMMQHGEITSSEGEMILPVEMIQFHTLWCFYIIQKISSVGRSGMSNDFQRAMLTYTTYTKSCFFHTMTSWWHS